MKRITGLFIIALLMLITIILAACSSKQYTHCDLCYANDETHECYSIYELIERAGFIVAEGLSTPQNPYGGWIRFRIEGRETIFANLQVQPQFRTSAHVVSELVLSDPMSWEFDNQVPLSSSVMLPPLNDNCCFKCHAMANYFAVMHDMFMHVPVFDEEELYEIKLLGDEILNDPNLFRRWYAERFLEDGIFILDDSWFREWQESRKQN